MKIRGFEFVKDEFKKNKKDVPTVEYDKKVVLPDGKFFYTCDELKIPERSTAGSAGYDFYLPIDLTLVPGAKTIIYSDVKAYMLEDEYLVLHLRSSVGIKHGLLLSNITGIIDASYYGNPDNDGNIGIALFNPTGRTVTMRKGERVAQGIFMKYLTADGETTTKIRAGGMGSTGK
jgi:dUTP pyrophosphatase